MVFTVKVVHVVRLDNQRIYFRFYQYMPMTETHLIGYKDKDNPMQHTNCNMSSKTEPLFIYIPIKVCLNRYSWGAGKLGSEYSSWFRQLECIS